MGQKRKRPPPPPKGPLSEILQQYEEVPALASSLLNGHVIHLYLNSGGRSPSHTSQLLLQKICPDAPPSSLKGYINVLVNASISKYKNLSRASDFDALKAVLRQNFHMPEFQVPTVPEQQPIPHSASAAASTTTQSPMKTRAVAKCAHCREKNMALRSCIKAKEQARQNHFLEIRDLKRRLEPIWKLNATIERRNKTIRSLREEIKDLKQINSRLTKTELEKKKQAEAAKKERGKVEKKFKRREQKMKRDLTMEFEDALTQALDKTTAKDLEKDGRAHSDMMRMVVYSCLDSNTPVGQVRNLLLRLSPILKLNLTPADIPVQSTVSIMALELGLWSDVFVGELLLAKKNITLAFDATTQDGVHVNAVHMTVENECYVLGLDHLPGGTAVDYASQVLALLQHHARLYAEVHCVSAEDTLRQMKSNISCIMSDRAVVNAAAVRILEDDFGSTLAHVHCNLHPIDSITSKCKTLVQSLERERGVACPSLYSGACLVEKFVLGMNTLRYKDGSGSPTDVKVALDGAPGLDRGSITHYRGNRLNVIFHLSFVYFQHFHFFKELVSVADTTLNIALTKCFALPMFRTELQAFGIFNKIFSGPWLTTFYTNEAAFSFVGSIDVVRNVVSRVKELLSLLSPTFIITTDVFGNTLDSSFPALFSLDNDVVTILKMMLSGSLDVIRKQYGSLLSLSPNDDDMKKMATLSQNARLHNMDAEEVVGMFSAAQSKAPNASIPFISARIRAKKNGTLDRLVKDPPSNFKKIIRLAGEIRTQRKSKTQAVMAEIRLRILKKKQSKSDKERKRIVAKLKNLKDLQRATIEQALPDHEENVDLICLILSGEAVQREVVHNWAEGDNFTTVPYDGRIGKKRGKGRRLEYSVNYWSSEESEDDGECYDMLAVELAADFLEGDLIFK